MRQRNYYEAYLDDFDKVIVYMSKESYGGVSNSFYLADARGSIIDLHIISIETTANNYHKYTLSLRESITIGDEYAVFHQHARSCILQYSGVVKTKQFHDLFTYDGNDLGFVYDVAQTSFALWAPTAYKVKVEIYKHNYRRTFDMIRTKQGVWRFSLLENLENASYVYFVRVNGEWKQTIDPYGIASIENSRRSAIIDPSKLKVKDYPLPAMESACDAIIYEASVRDFTIQSTAGVTMPGKYRGFVEENAITKEKQTGFSYLTSLGITHVQLMPVLDFGSVNELYPMLHYNWGYDPVQYRCLEGSFSNDPTNPYERMFDFIALVEKCHEHGIRVNLDVVFNHVYDKEESSFEKTVPNYYFQMNEHGDFSNGTYCGNDMDSKQSMCSKYIIDTCVWLVKMYHIDGFRFDLMGILDTHTLNQVYEKCVAINPDFMVYGEGWDMPSFLAQEERASIHNNEKMPYIAHFSDRFRDVVKGRTDANEVGVKGYCTGATYLIEIMKNCLSASCNDIGVERMLKHPRNAVNYVECHDNMTSWDKVKECCKEEPREVRIARQKMMNAAVLLAQGIPFLHAGQEFARTKHGMHNTYNESDNINKLDYERRDHYQSIVDCTKDLIAIRKNHKCLRYSTIEELQAHIAFDTIDQKVLLYKTCDDQEQMITIFNPTKNNYHYDLQGMFTLIYQNGTVDATPMDHIQIQAYDTLIFTRSL